MHLRHPDGFTPERFEQFRAGCRLFEAHVRTVLAEWQRLRQDPRAITGQYIFGEPVLSEDRRVATLPIDGSNTLGSRSEFENMNSLLLHRFLPTEFRSALEEGLEEEVTGELVTSWRPVGDTAERLIALADRFRTAAVSIDMTRDEALVLFDWLANRTDRLLDNLVDTAPQRVLWSLEAVLEKSLPVVLASDYTQQVAAARERLVGGA